MFLLADGEQPQAPTAHVWGKSEAEAQHCPVVTTPPVAVHSSASVWVPLSMPASRLLPGMQHSVPNPAPQEKSTTLPEGQAPG